MKCCDTGVHWDVRRRHGHFFISLQCLGGTGHGGVCVVFIITNLLTGAISVILSNNCMPFSKTTHRHVHLLFWAHFRSMRLPLDSSFLYVRMLYWPNQTGYRYADGGSNRERRVSSSLNCHLPCLYSSTCIIMHFDGISHCHGCNYLLADDINM